MNLSVHAKDIGLSASSFQTLTFLQTKNVGSRSYISIYERDTGKGTTMENESGKHKSLLEIFQSSDDGSFFLKNGKSVLVDLPHRGHDSSRNLIEMKEVKLPQVLKKLMEQQGIKAKPLAKKVGLPYSTVASYLSGQKSTYDVSHLSKIADYFGVDLETLLFDSPVKKLNLNALPRTTVFSNWCKVTIETIAAEPPTEKQGGKDGKE